MATAFRDGNAKPVWWGVSSTDGVTLVPIKVNSLTGKVLMEIGTSTMPVMSAIPENLPKDGNTIPATGGVSSANAHLIIPVSVNPDSGAIMAQST